MGKAAYDTFLGPWKREYGKKPSTTELKQAETLAKPGSKTAMALAMGLRPEGTTQSTLVKVLGLPHRNKIKKLVTEKKVKAKVTGKRPSNIKLEIA
jgi:hypothetical protein